MDTIINHSELIMSTTNYSVYRDRFDSLIQTNRSYQTKRLDLKGLLIGRVFSEFPDLSYLTWVTYLDLRMNKLDTVEKDKLPPNLDFLDLENNELTKLTPDMIPNSLTGIDLSHNRITNFEGGDFPNITEFSISSNPIQNVVFPPNTEFLSIDDCGLGSPTRWPKRLKDLSASNNLCSEFPSFPETTRTINISFNQSVTRLPYIPEGVKELNISGCNIYTVRRLPSSLVKFFAADAGIKYFHVTLFPPNLKKLDLSGNKLDQIPALPSKLVEADLSGNVLDTLKNVPHSMTKLDISDNCFTELDDELLNRDTLELKYEDNYIGQSCTSTSYVGTGTKSTTSYTPSYSSTYYGGSSGYPYSGSYGGTGTYYGCNAGISYGGNGGYGNYWKGANTTTYVNTRARDTNPYYIRNTKKVVV